MWLDWMWLCNYKFAMDLSKVLCKTRKVVNEVNLQQKKYVIDTLGKILGRAERIYAVEILF